MRLLIIILVTLSVNVAFAADLVTPNDRVVSHLNVRATATVDSNSVGILSANGTAELIKSVPYWYEVKLPSGATGFVSKRWATVISTNEGTGQLLRIGSWNIRKLGHGTKDFSKVAQAIDENFDVLVIVEVMQKQRAHRGYDTLIAELGAGWKGLLTDSPRPNTKSSNSEFYAILYRPSLIRPCNGWNKLIYYQDNDGSGNAIGTDTFSREPAFGCFEAPMNNSTIGFDFLIAAFHATFKSKSAIKAEARHLGEVFSFMASTRPGEDDLIIAGDFNLVPRSLTDVSGMTVNTVGTGSTFNTQGKLTRNVYDHILVFDTAATKEQIKPATIIDLTSMVSGGTEYLKKMSDHLPVVSYFDTTGPDDD